MSGEDRGTIEAEIARILLDQWDPLGVRGQPDALERYASYAQHAYALLVRGASDVQIARRLHMAERDELQHPELVDHDLTALVRSLRALESRL
jgi:hypothetical protein